ncbi:YbaB/EbfC family nucleoid-associated protein [Kitasatospora sp. NPDC056181]|uniref:YbaB/EbfC family nucleoid-associated protein n=1 Tax=Kitasatospora sp. NPDC056181 TaxID=3345737 RepID=UPI0035E24358
MTMSFAEQLEQALAELEEQQAKMAQAAKELQASTASATSKDRMVTAKVGPQGEILALTFHTVSYQSMAPAQLSAVLMDVLNEAKARMGDQIAKSMRSFEGVGESLRLSLTGESDPDWPSIGLDLDALLAPLTAMRPGHDPAAGQGRAKQEEFNG